MPILVPSILTVDPEDLAEKLEFLQSVKAITDAQIDFADGQFVPNKTVLPRDLPPFETSLRLEAHLMVTRPQEYLQSLEALGFTFVYMHYECFAVAGDLQTAMRNAAYLGISCGVAVNPTTDLQVLDQFAGEVKNVLLMGVHPGFQGQKFLPETLERVTRIKERFPQLIIEVDGGVNIENISSLVAAGADRLIVGSALWQTPDPQKTIHEFLNKLK